jgi:Lon protease-like protein
VVLFPKVAMPLHIFELRYRTMVRDALSSGRSLAMALLKPGWESEYQGSPEFHPLVCLARIDEVNWLPNDCYDLRVRGLSRARVLRVTREFPYRSAQLELDPEHPFPADDPLVKIELHALLDACRRLAASVGVEAGVSEALGFEALVNAACAGSPLDAEEKLALLAEDSVIERGRRVRERIEASLRTRSAPRPGDGEHN